MRERCSRCPCRKLQLLHILWSIFSYTLHNYSGNCMPGLTTRIQVTSLLLAICSNVMIIQRHMLINPLSPALCSSPCLFMCEWKPECIRWSCSRGRSLAALGISWTVKSVMRCSKIPLCFLEQKHGMVNTRMEGRACDPSISRAHAWVHVSSFRDHARASFPDQTSSDVLRAAVPKLTIKETAFSILQGQE